MTDQEIAAQVRKAAAEFNQALEKAKSAQLEVMCELTPNGWDEAVDFGTSASISVTRISKTATF